MAYTVYLYKNKINNKVYVGLTSTSLKKRFSRHYRKARYKCKLAKGNYFQRALVKYERSDWELSILDTCETLDEAEMAEKKWITHFSSNEKKFGYNLTEGGNVSQSSLDDRVRKKISDSVSKLWQDGFFESNSAKIRKWYSENDNPFKGKKHSEESKLKMSQSIKCWHQKNENPFQGKKHSEESRKRMSEAAQRRCADPNWQPPLVKNGISEETRQRMSLAAQNRERKSSFCTKEEVLELAKKHRSQKEMALELSCTPANLSYLIKSWNIKDDVKAYLKEVDRKDQD